MILRRPELAVLYENMKPKWHSSFNAPPSPLQGPVQLSHPCVSSTLAGHKLVLRKLKNGNNMPLTYFMGQAGGLFIVEFFWQRPGNAGGTGDTKNDWHVIAGSCAPSLSPSLSLSHTRASPFAGSSLRASVGPTCNLLAVVSVHSELLCSHH